MLQHPKSTPTKLDNDGPTVLVVEDSRTTSSAIATGSMAASLHADCVGDGIGYMVGRRFGLPVRRHAHAAAESRCRGHRRRRGLWKDR
jgi:hypothetical protein